MSEVKRIITTTTTPIRTRASAHTKMDDLLDRMETLAERLEAGGHDHEVAAVEEAREILMERMKEIR